jgi:Sortase domain
VLRRPGSGPGAEGRAAVAALLLGGLLASGAAAGYLATRPPRHDYGAVPAAGHPRVAAGRDGAAAGRSRPPDGRLPGLVAVHVPVRLQIPALGVNAAVVPVGVGTHGQLAIPADPSAVGWWAGGAGPGQAAGAVVVAGHIDSAVRGPGALLRLPGARPGDTVTLRAAGHLYRYVVRAVRAYPKAGLPATVVFGQRVTPRLVIVSCGGPFDAATGHYLDNIVAYALPAGPAAPGPRGPRLAAAGHPR